MKTLYNLRLFVIALMALVSTGAFAQDELPIPLTFLSDGGTQDININESNVAWKLTCDAQWVKISPAEATGPAKVTVTVDANPTEEERQADLVLDTGYGFVNHLFVIKQKGKVGAGISGPAVSNSRRSSDVRTLTGMKVNSGNLRRGIYIVNGKKVVR